MSNLELCVDPFECEYPGLVTECLSVPTDRFNIIASINFEGYCSLLCQKNLYVWNCIQTDRSKLPRCYRLAVPSTGLSYSNSSVCFYKREGQKLPGVLIVSPEGTIRHYPELGDVYKDQIVELNSEVAFSIDHIGSKNQVHRFILATTTSSFYVVEVFQGAKDRPQNLTYFPVDLNKKGTFTRKMSALIWGSPVSDKLQKSIVLPTPNKEIELVCLYSGSLHFYSIKKNTTIAEVNICEGAFIEFGSILKVDTNALKRDYQIRLLDATLFEQGVLVLIVLINSETGELHLALGYTSFENLSKQMDAFDIIKISSLDIDEDALNRATLHAPTTSDYCVVAFPKIIIAVYYPLDEHDSQTYTTTYEDELLGTGVYDTHCQVLLKKNGVSTVRILPRFYDLTFWRKFRSVLLIEEFPKDNNALLKKAFATFCSKDMKLAEATVQSMLARNIDDLSDLAVDFAKQAIDGVPIHDSRWGLENRPDMDDSMVSRERSSLMLIRDQLLDKISFYRMYTVFVKYFDIVSKLSPFMSSYDDRSASVVLTEFGEKLYAMYMFIELIIGYSLPFVENLIRKVARSRQARSPYAGNVQLSDFDHFCKEVTKINQFISSTILAESDELIQNAGNDNLHKELVMQLSAFIVTVISGFVRLREEPWSIKTPKDAPTWLNHPPFLNNFVKHLTIVLDLLSSEQLDRESHATLLEQGVYIARFVLGEQNRWQRDNSPIINRLYDMGQKELAISLAEEFLDFTTIIRHCHESRSDNERRSLLEHYKKKFSENDFDLFLYEYYRKKGMVSHLLEEKGGRVENFLSSYENIGWIKNIANGEYDKARDILKAMSYEAMDASKKQSLLSLGKLTAICSGQQDPVEMAEFNHGLRLLIHQNKIPLEIRQRINPHNRPMTVEEIVLADLQEDNLEGYLKALLAAAVPLESPQSDPQREASLVEGLKDRVWTSALAKDSWSVFPIEPESFEMRADASFFIALMGKFIELDIPTRIKTALAPNIETIFDGYVAGQRGIPAETRKILKHFISATIDEARRAIENTSD